jgi:hypothetical protein
MVSAIDRKHCPLSIGTAVRLHRNPQRNKRPKLDWYLKNNAPGLLVQNGWEGIPLCWRENPCHSDELRKRVDALAHHIGKGKFDPAHKGVRARTRWAKAFSDTFR